MDALIYGGAVVQMIVTIGIVLISGWAATAGLSLLWQWMHR